MQRHLGLVSTFVHLTTLGKIMDNIGFKPDKSKLVGKLFYEFLNKYSLLFGKCKGQSQD